MSESNIVVPQVADLKRYLVRQGLDRRRIFQDGLITINDERLGFHSRNPLEIKGASFILITRPPFIVLHDTPAIESAAARPLFYLVISSIES